MSGNLVHFHVPDLTKSMTELHGHAQCKSNQINSYETGLAQNIRDLVKIRHCKIPYWLEISEDAYNDAAYICGRSCTCRRKESSSRKSYAVLHVRWFGVRGDIEGRLCQLAKSDVSGWLASD